MYLLMGRIARFAMELSTSSGIASLVCWSLKSGNPLSICKVIKILLRPK